MNGYSAVMKIAIAILINYLSTEGSNENIDEARDESVRSASGFKSIVSLRAVPGKIRVFVANRGQRRRFNRLALERGGLLLPEFRPVYVVTNGESRVHQDQSVDGLALGGSQGTYSHVGKERSAHS